MVEVNEGDEKPFKIKLYKVIADPDVTLTGQDHYYKLCASHTLRKGKLDHWVTCYKNIRLPEDPEILDIYLK